jgi:hypothetical protein
MITPTSNTTPVKAINLAVKPDNNWEHKATWKCQFDHSDFHMFVPESDSRYCFKGRDFDGVHCTVPTCNKLFVHCTKGKTDCFKPTGKRPLYACENCRQKCPYAICFECNNNLLLNYVRKTKLLHSINFGNTTFNKLYYYSTYITQYFSTL